MRRQQGTDFLEEESRLQSVPDSETLTTRAPEHRENGVKLIKFRAISDSPTRQPQNSGTKFADESK